MSAKPTPESRHALFAATVSVVMSFLLLGAKYWAYRITHSQAVYSDAMETIANVVASLLALIVLFIAAKPADRDHPYGHGKVEFFSAAFEGALISFAAVMIVFTAIQALIRGAQPEHIQLGLLVLFVTGIVNLGLGFYLLRAGRRHNSATLEASGQHVLSDFWTSAGVIIGLGLVQLTGLAWLDPVAAIAVGLWLGWTGLKLVRRSGGGLLDAEDRGSLEKLVYLLGRDRPAGIIQVHHLRVMRSGSYHHIDAHAVLPEYWDVSRAHAEVARFEKEIMRDYPNPGELHLHVDPCRRAYCRECEVLECPIRCQEFEHRRYLSLDELTNPDEPKLFGPAPSDR